MLKRPSNKVLYYCYITIAKKSPIRKKVATGTFTHNSWRAKTFKATLIKTYRKFLKPSNLAHRTSQYKDKKFKNRDFLVLYWLCKVLMHGIVVKFTAIIFFLQEGIISHFGNKITLTALDCDVYIFTIINSQHSFACILVNLLASQLTVFASRFLLMFVYK